MSEPTEPPINICPNCGADLFKVGIIKGISGGHSKTEIHFVNGRTATSNTDIQDFNDQWTLCIKCHEDIEYTAMEIIEAYERLHTPKEEPQ